MKRAAAQEPGARIRKAVGWGMIDHSLPVEERFRLAKDVGFEGVEVTRHSREEETDPRVLARASQAHCQVAAQLGDERPSAHARGEAYNDHRNVQHDQQSFDETLE